MQIFNATNVVLNSIRLATPSVKVAGGEGGSLRSLEKFCEVAKKNAKMSRFYGVLVERRWRSLSGLGCDEIQKFNATNVVLNSIRLATPCKSGGGRVEVCVEKFSRLREKCQNIPVLRCSS